jgi:hypothetical protein
MVVLNFTSKVRVVWRKCCDVYAMSCDKLLVWRAGLREALPVGNHASDRGDRQCMRFRLSSFRRLHLQLYMETVLGDKYLSFSKLMAGSKITWLTAFYAYEFTLL